MLWSQIAWTKKRLFPSNLSGDALHCTKSKQMQNPSTANPKSSTSSIFIHSFTDLQNFMYVLINVTPNRACYVLPRQSRWCGSKKSEESGRDIVNLSTLLRLKPGSPHQAPHLDAFDSNIALFQIQVRHVAVGLQSFRQDLHFAALRRGRNGQRLAAPRLHGGNVRDSVANEVLSGEIQVRNAGLVQDSCQRLAHPIIQKLLHFYWNDLMILVHPFSIFTCFHSVRPAWQARRSQWTEPHVFGSGPPPSMSRSQASSCLVVCENTLLGCTWLYLYHGLSPNLTERKPSKFSRPQGFFLGHYKSAGYRFECSTWRHITNQSNCLLYLKWLEWILFGLGGRTSKFGWKKESNSSIKTTIRRASSNSNRLHVMSSNEYLQEIPT